MSEHQLWSVEETGRRLSLAFDAVEEPKPVRPRRRLRGTAYVFAAAAACAVIAILVVGLGHGDSRAGVQDALADVAHKVEVAPQPTPSQFQYTNSRSIYTSVWPAGIDPIGELNSPFVMQIKRNSQSWINPSRDGRLVWKASNPTFPTALDAERGTKYFAATRLHDRLEKIPVRRRTAVQRRLLRAANARVLAFNRKRGLNGYASPETPGVSRGTFDARGNYVIGAELLTAAQLKNYPRDPQQIYTRVRKVVEDQMAKDAKFNASLPKLKRISPGSNPDGEEQIWNTLASGASGDWQPPVPADLRAAMIRALAFLPGVKDDGEASDAFGRPGDQFSFDHAGIHNTVLFSKDDAVLLASSSTVTDPKELRNPQFRHLPAGVKLNGFQLVEQKTLPHLPKNAGR